MSDEAIINANDQQINYRSGVEAGSNLGENSARLSLFFSGGKKTVSSITEEFTITRWITDK